MAEERDRETGRDEGLYPEGLIAAKVVILFRRTKSDHAEEIQDGRNRRNRKKPPRSYVYRRRRGEPRAE